MRVAMPADDAYTLVKVVHSASYQGILDDLERGLKPVRFMHVLGVTHTAVQLAFRHGLNPDLAALAGLVHDRSKGMTPEAIETDLGRRGVTISEEDRPFPAIWHGLHAAVWLRQDSGLLSGEELETVAQAVQFHSTSDRGLGPLGQLLFVADYLEPGRYFAGIDELRRRAQEDLEAGYESCLAAKCRYVIKKGSERLHPRAARAMEQFGIRPEDEVGTGPSA